MSATIPEPIADLLREVAARGIELRPHGEHLRFRPVAAMPADLRESLRAHEQEVLSVLGNRTPPPADTFRYSDGLLDFGEIPEGWLPARWAGELRRKAGRCDVIRPDIVERYRAWADDIERRGWRRMRSDEECATVHSWPSRPCTHSGTAAETDRVCFGCPVLRPRPRRGAIRDTVGHAAAYRRAISAALVVRAAFPAASRPTRTCGSGQCTKPDMEVS